MPITARMPIAGAHALAASGRNGMAMRTNPYVPSFSRIAARITEPCVGAWVWASGSQVWNGNIGTLTAKPTNIPAKIQICTVRPSVGPWLERGTGSEKLSAPVWANRARKATSISAEPNIV